MNIERLLRVSRNSNSDKEVIEMIISNHINYYCGDQIGAAVTMKNFSLLADDILFWHKSKEGERQTEQLKEGEV